MKNNDSGNDEKLGTLLKEWRADASLPTRFQEAVWRRIERADVRSTPAVSAVWDIVSRWIGSMLPRPALATAYVTVLLAIGITAGWAQARHETSRVSDQLSMRYIQSVDPYQASR